MPVKAMILLTITQPVTQGHGNVLDKINKYLAINSFKNWVRVKYSVKLLKGLGGLWDSKQQKKRHLKGLWGMWESQNY